MTTSSSSTSSGGHSAEVRMTLCVDGTELPVSQVGGGMIYFHQEVSLPPHGSPNGPPDGPPSGSTSGPPSRPGECVLTMTVDGQVAEWDVLLADHPLRCSAVAAEFRFRGSPLETKSI